MTIGTLHPFTDSISAIADAVRQRRVTAVELTDQFLSNIERRAAPLCAITRLLTNRARHDAAAVDATIADGKDPGPLAGVPYGVKDLFDVKGLPTTAGSSLYSDAPPAKEDAEAVRRLKEAGAVLVATLNMDEFAYGFATINARHGTTRNPHDQDRLAGGSSGGSAAVVAAGLFPFSLGSDTNGSIRVPASLTGLYGLKPTHDVLPMGGVFPFAESFDDIGPFARSAADMRLIWEILSGKSALRPERPLRIARMGGRFRENADPDQITAIDTIAPDAPMVNMPDIARARSAAFLITAYEGGALHKDALAKNAMLFDPATRDRLIAGALLPQHLYEAAQKFRADFKVSILKLIEDYDILLAPATPCPAPPIADPRILIDGAMTAARADLGIHTQPISFTGLPSLAVPLNRPDRLPLGLQIIGKPHSEGTLFHFAAMLEKQGLAGVSPPDIALQGDI